MRRRPGIAGVRMAAGILRMWTRVYTWGMPSDVAERRRAEVESDLWEFVHDADAGDRLSRSLQILARLAAGIPDDLAWRLDHGTLDDVRLLRRAVTLAAVAAAIAMLWTSPGDGARMADCVNGQSPRRARVERVLRCVDAFFERAGM